MKLLKQLGTLLLMTIAVLYIHGANYSTDELGTHIFPASINVKDFGAKGDGMNDDTAAIQNAAAEAARINATLRSFVGRRYHNGGIGDGAQREIVFPEGSYLISDTVFFKRDVILRGVGKVVIRQTVPSKDIFYFYSAFRCRITNLEFEGGKRQLLFWTQNNDSANLRIQNCRFRSSSGAALESRSHRIMENGKWRLLGAYRLVRENGKEFLREDVRDQATPFANSTLLMIEDCDFLNCRRAADFGCVGAVIRNCRVVSHVDAVGGVFLVENKVHAYDLDILVKRNPVLKQYVFECGGRSNLCFEKSRIWTDSGKGVCPVYSKAKPGYIASSFILRDLTVEAAEAPENAILYCGDGTVPNLISINAVTETSGKKVKAIGFQEDVSEDMLRRNRRFPHFTLEQTYQFAIGRNSSSVDDSVPPVFERFRAEFPAVMPLYPYPKAAKLSGPVFYAGDFGVDCNLNTDDTAAVKKVFAVASKHKNSIVVFPGTWINLNETVSIPDHISVTSAGVTGFRSGKESIDLFHISHAAEVKLSNLMFQGGRHAVSIIAPESMKSNLILNNCYFYDCASYAVNAQAGKDMKNIKNKMTVLLNGGVAFTSKLYRGNASIAYSDAQWLSTLPETPKESPAKECVAIQNYGELQILDMLTVPMAFSWTSMSDTLAATCSAGDYRWIDNYGNLHCFNARFGGEWGGLCPVFHCGKGHVYLEGGYAWFESRKIARCPVLADSPSADSRMFNVVCSPNLGIPVRMLWRSAVSSKPYVSRKQNITNIFPGMLK